MKNRIYIPTTATIFFLLTILTALLSWIGSIYGLKEIQSLLSADALRWELRNAIPNYVETPALGIVMILFIGCGLCIYSGLPETLKRLFLHNLNINLKGNNGEKPHSMASSDNNMITRKQKRALIQALICLVVYVTAISICISSPFAILRGITGTLENSAFSAGIFYIISFGIGLCGIAYGYTSGFLRNDKDILCGMTYLIKNHSIYFVTLFFIVQFFTLLIYSGIPRFVGINESTIFFIFYFTTYLPLIQLFIGKGKKK